MMTVGITPVNSQCGVNTATINAIGSAQLATGGGYIAGPPTIKIAGSDDCTASLYDGTSTSGTLLATFSLGSVGPAMMPNFGFVSGLFVEVTGTTAGTCQVSYTGTAA